MQHFLAMAWLIQGSQEWMFPNQTQWHMSVIPATREVEDGGLQV